MNVTKIDVKLKIQKLMDGLKKIISGVYKKMKLLKNNNAFFV